MLRAYGLTALAAGVFLSAAYITYLNNFLLFHGLVELFCVAVAWGVFFLAWNSRRFTENHYPLFLGIGYFFVGLVDLLHTLAYKGMGVFSGYGTDLPTALWIAARGLEAATLALALVFLKRRLDHWAGLAGFALATALLLAAIFSGWFPACFVEGQGLTPFKVGAEYALCLVLAGTAAAMYLRASEFSSIVLNYLMASIVLTIFSELTFTLYTDPFGLTNTIGHCFKFASFILVYKAVMEIGLSKPYDLLFRNLKMSEGALKASEKRYRMIFENSPLGLVGYDARGVILDCNDRFVDFMGAPRQALIGFHAATSMPDGPAREALAKALAGKNSVFEGEYQSATSGMKSLIRAIFNPILSESGEVAGVIATVEDISERKRAEALKEDMERVARHDLMGPLNNILAVPDLLLAEGGLTTDQRESMRILESSSKRMLKIIRRSLDLHKMETGGYHIHPVPVDLGEVAERMADNISRRSDYRAIPVQVRVMGKPVDQAGPFMVLGEEELCATMLGNLIENAVEAANGFGRPVTVDMEISNGRAWIGITNMGAVPEDVRGRFFEKYATSGKKKGTGLGTYSAMLNARVQGGDIGFTTTDTETVVWVTLPRADG